MLISATNLAVLLVAFARQSYYSKSATARRAYPKVKIVANVRFSYIFGCDLNPSGLEAKFRNVED